MSDVCALCGQGWCECGIETDATPLTLAAKLSALPLVPTPDELELLGQLRGILAHGGGFPSHQCLNCTARLPICQHSWTVVEPIGGVLWCGRCGALGPAKLPRLPRSYVQCVAHAHIYTRES